MAPASDTEPSHLQTLPPELAHEILTLSCPDLLEPQCLPLALHKARYRSPMDITIGPQFELIDRTNSVRTLLSICQLTRSIALYYKPNTICFATGRKRLPVNTTQPGDRKSYPTSTVMDNNKTGIVRYNGTRDIIFVHSLYPSTWLENDCAYRNLELCLPEGFCVQAVQILHLQEGVEQRGSRRGSHKILNAFLQQFTSLRKMYLSTDQVYCFQPWSNIAEEIAASFGECDYFHDGPRIRCYLREEDVTVADYIKQCAPGFDQKGCQFFSAPRIYEL